MNDLEHNSPDTVCPHCGVEATWRFLDEEQPMVEIACPDCGRFELSRAEFGQAEFDIAQQKNGGSD